MTIPRITDDDLDTITVTLAGTVLQSWGYASEAERRAKMRHAHAFVDGWCARDEAATQAETVPQAAESPHE